MLEHKKKLYSANIIRKIKMYAIHADNLTKRFDGLTAVDQISFSVREGELFGLLGLNGAGKTTTIKMLSTLLKPASGYAEVAGFNILTQKDEIRSSGGLRWK